MKKIIILLLCCGVLVSMVGCGDNTAPPPTESPTTTVSETIITETHTETIPPVTAVEPTEEIKPTEPVKTTVINTVKEKVDPQITESKTAETEPPKDEPKAETEPPKVTEPEPTKKPAPFDSDHWIAYARSYAESKGLVLSDTTVDCWDNPIRAGAHCMYLERDIQSRLNRYAKDEDITNVWIWAEAAGNNCYDIYIGYA